MTQENAMPTISDIIEQGEDLGYYRVFSNARRADKAEEVADYFKADDATAKFIEATLRAEYERRKEAKANGKDASQPKEDTRPITAGADTAEDGETKLPAGKYIVFAVQNNTDANLVALACLQNMADKVGAQLIGCRMRYNKNAFQQGLDVVDDELFYAPELKPYIMEGNIDIGGQVLLMADANVLPTAKNPLSGFQLAGGSRDVIIPASSYALQCLPALKGREPKRLASTGALTKRNYIMRKAGAVAALAHNIGGLFVEVFADERRPQIRQLEVMPGSSSVYDFDGVNAVEYTKEGVMCLAQPAALNLGDIHAEKMSDTRLENICRLVANSEAQAIICHDVLDFTSRNHHNRKNPTFLYEQTCERATVEGDLFKVRKVLFDIVSAAAGEVYVIRSNHDDALIRWLDESDYKLDPENALTYLEMQAARYKAIKEGRDYYPLRDYLRMPEGVAFNDTDESLVIAGVEMGEHGHHGANGSKGSPSQFRNWGVKMNTGHTHSPSIYGGVYTAGVSAALDMGYNVGASAWAYAHIITFENGARQVFFE